MHGFKVETCSFFGYEGLEGRGLFAQDGAEGFATLFMLFDRPGMLRDTTAVKGGLCAASLVVGERVTSFFDGGEVGWDMGSN